MENSLQSKVKKSEKTNDIDEDEEIDEEEENSDDDDYQWTKKIKLNEKYSDHNTDDTGDVNDDNEISNTLLINILNNLMQNKKKEKQGFLSDLSKFLDCDHDERGKFIQSKSEFLPKIRELCDSI